MEPDTELLSDLKGRAAGRRNRRRFAMAAAAVGAAAAIALGVVIVQDDSSDDKVDAVSPVFTPTTGPPLTGTSSTSPSTTTTAPEPKTDWTGERFDLGVIKELRLVNGTWVVAFDRIQFTEHEGGKSGPDFTEEPVLCCHTDAMTENTNPMLRTYRVSNQVEVLQIGNRPYTCPGDWESQAPRWDVKPFAEIARTSKWDQWDGVALTFDRQGTVIRIRLTGGC